MLANLFDKSVELASEVNSSDEITSKEKLLNVYFIFFENMAMNRSLVLMILGNNKLHSAKMSNQLKETHRQFIRTLGFNDWEMIQKAKDDVKISIKKLVKKLCGCIWSPPSNFGKRHISLI